MSDSPIFMGFLTLRYGDPSFLNKFSFKESNSKVFKSESMINFSISILCIGSLLKHFIIHDINVLMLD